MSMGTMSDGIGLSFGFWGTMVAGGTAGSISASVSCWPCSSFRNSWNCGTMELLLVLRCSSAAGALTWLVELSWILALCWWLSSSRASISTSVLLSQNLSSPAVRQNWFVLGWLCLFIGRSWCVRDYFKDADEAFLEIASSLDIYLLRRLLHEVITWSWAWSLLRRSLRVIFVWTACDSCTRALAFCWRSITLRRMSHPHLFSCCWVGITLGLICGCRLMQDS